MSKQVPSLVDELVQYSESVRGGTVPACLKHRWACERFLRDTDRAGTADFPYVFIPERAERFFRWVGLFKHRKGVLKGRPIELAPVQRFVYGNIYGWYHMVTGYRRFTKFYWQVARKNAKSQLLAAMGLYELMAFDETGTETMEVYCAATKTEQARIVFDEAHAMLRGCELLKGRWKEAYRMLIHKRTESVMRALSREDRKSGDGLNVQFGIVDEYHAHETTELYDVIDSGMGARAEPMLGIITTAGFDLANPCYRVEYQLVRQILDPDAPVELDTYFAMVNELEVNDTAEPVTVGGRTVPPGEMLDDMYDEAAWRKANPIVCSYPEGISYLRQRAAEAKLAPEKLRSFKTKHLNVWVNERDCGYMNVARWAACGGEIPELSGKGGYVGLDLSARNDLTSVGLEWKLEDLYVCLSHSFIPESKLEGHGRGDLVDYELWASQGWMTVTEGEVVDYRRVISYTREWLERLGCHALAWCVDPWGATQVTADLIDAGETVVDIIQGIKTLSEPTKDFRNMTLEGRIVHDSNPVFGWALGNAVVSIVDRNENIILAKNKARSRIDPVTAMLNAHTLAMAAEPEREPRILFA